MYILKNALRNVRRAKLRNILIGLIVLIIAISSCLGLSIRQAAVNARQTGPESLSVTARSPMTRRSFWRMSQQATWMKKPKKGSSQSCAV